MATKPNERLRAARVNREISQAQLAQRAGISRQALGAIESGVYSPGVEVALRLARELGATVESLFAESPDERPIVAEYGASGLSAERQRIMLARIGGHLVAVPTPAISMTLTPSGGLVSRTLRNRRVEVASFRSEAEIDATLVIAGCDPGVAILRDYLARHQPTIVVAAISGSSREALAAVVKGNAHVAGIHLRDAQLR